MAVSFRVFPSHSLVLVRCRGAVDLDQSLAAFHQYMQHTDFRHGQSQIVDLRDVVSYERDFTRIMEFQALRTEAFMGASAPIHLIYIAPNEATHAMAMTALRSWKDIDGIIALILGSIEEACDVLAIDATVLVASDADAA